MSATPVQFTGERFLPECEGEIWAEHWHRYLFARKFVSGRDVLDAASGEGYGSAWLAGSAATVVGLDIDRPTVEAARQRYAAANLRFEVGSVSAMPFADASFDCVVSFETLEHLAEQEDMLHEIRRVLRPSGFLLISTPNRAEYTDRRDFHNEFHVRELDRNQFHQLLARHFQSQRWFGQKLLFNSAIWPISPAAEFTIEWIALEDRPQSLPEPMYYIACAAATEDCIPSADDLSLLADPSEAVYREYEQTVKHARLLDDVVRRREATVIERDAQLREVAARASRLERLALERAAIVDERDRQIAAQSARAAQMETLIIERESVIARRDAEAALHQQAMAERERIVAERDRQLEEVNGRSTQLEQHLVDRERIIVERDAQMAAMNERIASIEALVDARDRELAAVNARIQEAERLLAHRESVIVERDAQLESLNGERDRLTQAVAGLETQRDALLAEVTRRAGVRWWMALPYRRLRALTDPSVLGSKTGKA